MPTSKSDTAPLRRSASIYLAEMIAVFAIGFGALGGGIKLFGDGPLASVCSVWLANLAMLSAIHGGLRWRGQSWAHFGLRFRAEHVTAKSFYWTVLQSIPVFVFAILAFVVGAIVMANIVGVPEPADMSKYNYLQGNLGLTVLALCSVYAVSSFAEEAIYRGFLMTRMMELGGHKSSRCFAVGLSAVIFGSVHSDWGIAGMVQASCMGVALGVSYLIVKRNLWVLILAHAYMDTILILQMYFSKG